MSEVDDTSEEPIERSPEEELERLMSLAETAASVVEETAGRVITAASEYGVDSEEYKQAQEQAKSVIERAQEALNSANAATEKVDEEEHPEISIREIAKALDKEVARIKAVKAEKEEEKRLKEEKAKPLTDKEREEQTKARKIEIEAINDRKQGELELVKAALKPRYNKLRGSLTTLFMLPNLSPIHIERDGKLSEPNLVCYYGRLKRTNHGHKTARFRTVISVDPSGDGYTLDNQAWRTFIDGAREMTRYGWGTDMHGEMPNPKENMSYDDVINFMHNRLDDVEAEHKSMLPGRALKATIGALIIGGGIYLGAAEASTLDGTSSNNNEDDNLPTLVVDDSLRIEPEVLELFKYDVDSTGLDASSKEGPDF